MASQSTTTSETKKTYKIHPNLGEPFEVKGTRAEVHDLSHRITIWDGVEVVASVAGGSFHVA